MTIGNDDNPPLSYASSPHTRDFIAAGAPGITINAPPRGWRTAAPRIALILLGIPIATFLSFIAFRALLPDLPAFLSAASLVLLIAAALVIVTVDAARRTHHLHVSPSTLQISSAGPLGRRNHAYTRDEIADLRVDPSTGRILLLRPDGRTENPFARVPLTNHQIAPLLESLRTTLNLPPGTNP